MLGRRGRRSGMRADSNDPNRLSATDDAQRSSDQHTIQGAEARPDKPDISTLECSYCLEKIDGMVDPRVLPCGHIHCKPCLESHVAKDRVIQCPQCRGVMTRDGKVESLPCADQPQGDMFKCEPCQKKGRDVPTAFYCAACSKQMCAKHLESHDDLFTAHKVLSIEDYKAKAKKLDIRTCSVHSNQPYIMGCKTCKNVLCHNCVTEQAKCEKAKGPHTMTSLDDLEMEAKEEIGSQRATLAKMEELLEKRVKETNVLDSKLEEERDKMVMQIRNMKDKHLKDVAAQYDELERKLCSDRTRIHKTLTDYIDSTVAVRQKELKQIICQTDQALKDHQVDIISGRKRRVDNIQKIISEGVQPLNVKDVKVVKAKGTRSDINLMLAADPIHSIRIDFEAVTTKQPPTPENPNRVVDFCPGKPKREAKFCPVCGGELCVGLDYTYLDLGLDYTVPYIQCALCGHKFEEPDHEEEWDQEEEVCPRCGTCRGYDSWQGAERNCMECGHDFGVSTC